MPDGTVKYLHVVGHAVRDQAEDLEFIGSVMDVTAAKHAEEELHKAQARSRACGACHDLRRAGGFDRP